MSESTNNTTTDTTVQNNTNTVDAGSEKTIVGNATETDKSIVGTATTSQEKGTEEVKATVTAPESYADFKVEEGLMINKEGMEEFKKVAKSLNLTQDNAQKLIDMQSSLLKKQNESQMAEFNKQISEWEAETIKRLGPDKDRAISYVGKAVDRFGTPELRDFFNKTGIGNHPELVDFFKKVGMAISEDTLSDGKGGKASKTAAEIFYPNMTGNK